MKSIRIVAKGYITLESEAQKLINKSFMNELN